MGIYIIVFFKYFKISIIGAIGAIMAQLWRNGRNYGAINL